MEHLLITMTYLCSLLSFTKGLSQADCNFDNGNICNYANSAGGQFSWTVRKGETPSDGTGPSSDVSGGGYYLYIETSFPRKPGDKATILTSFLSGSQCLAFSYHMYGSNIGDLNVYVNNQTIFSKSGNQENKWVAWKTSISHNGTYTVMFEGVRGNGYQGDIAIDAINFTPGPCPKPSPPTSEAGCGNVFLSRIVDGQTARPHSWPWQVSLRSIGSTFHFCGGSLINDQWVVTAAHCVRGRLASSLNVRLGEHDFNSNGGSEIDRRVVQVIMHPKYDRPTTNYDIALIKLSQRVSLNPQIQPICLPQQGVSVDEVSGQDCYITGWGRTGANRPGATVLQQANLPVISQSKCRQHMGVNRNVTQKMVCAGFGGSSTVSGCFGDSGGPFVCPDKSSNRWILQGAVSWGTTTCGAGYNEFTVFARVSEFVDWINGYVSNVQPPSLSASCNFDKGNICSYQNGPNDASNFNWEVNKGSTPSVGTGPSSDVSGKGYYLYIETSNPRQLGDKATILTSELNGPQCMSFSYHMYGRNIGDLNIYANNQNVFTKSGNQGNKWVDWKTPISQNGTYRVTFEGVCGNGYQGDIVIDSINFTPGNCPSQTSKLANCNFDRGNICSYQNGTGQFNWTLRKGSTPSSATGPSSDVSGGGNYAYIETSSPRVQGDQANLVSPQVSGAQCLEFSYHMYGSSMGSLIVYQNTGSQITELFRKSGDQGNQWKKAEVQIYGENSYSIVFRGVRGTSFRGDIALDEISTTPGQCSGFPVTPSPSIPTPPSGSCGQKGYGLSDFPRIVGGQQATPGEWPWQVALLRGSSSPFCGGSLVSNQYVITAAHCVRASDWDRVTIRLGEHNTNVNEGHEQTISIATNGITVHPQYDSDTTDYDIAVIRLSRSVQFTQRIKPVCFNKGVDFTGQRCYITGWGTLSSGGSTPTILQEAQVPIVTTQECRNSYGSSSITDRMLCAGYSQGGIDSCQGDSGGPLVCRHSDGSWYLTGITSWGRGCALAGYYGVYAHVANLYPWVNQVTGLSF